MKNILILIAILILQTQSNASEFKFPSHFMWCAATAAHQVEGGIKTNNWWNWERKKGTIVNGDTTEVACDHWNRYKEDFALMKSISINTYRMSVEWARIEPQKGVWDQAAIKHYQAMFRELKKHGSKPIVTLHHFTLPQWVDDEGGWLNPKIIEYFERYTEIVYHSFGQDIQYWVTINEPIVFPLGTYIAGKMPPGEINNFENAFKALVNVGKSHAKSYRKLHMLAEMKQHKIMVGLANHLRIFHPYRQWNPLDQLVASIFGKAYNWTILNGILTGKMSLKIPLKIWREVDVPEMKNTQDFFGLNYYSRELMKFDFSDPNLLSRPLADKSKLDELNIEIYPEGFPVVLGWIKEKFPHLPIIITENGLSDRDDSHRSQYIKDHLQVIASAIEQNINILGYCHWSLMDNFEWAEGYHPRLGLIEVDYKTLKRKIRPSAIDYKKIIEKNAIDIK